MARSSSGPLKRKRRRDERAAPRKSQTLRTAMTTAPMLRGAVTGTAHTQDPGDAVAWAEARLSPPMRSTAEADPYIRATRCATGEPTPREAA